MSSWSARIEGMIHPGAASDAFLLPLHRNFLIFCFASGAGALLVLPLHLALAGPPQIAVLLVLAWMLSQWPLALYLSQSGNIDRAVGVSASLFACFLAGICMLTGGLGSFALPWLLVPPIEAAFSTRKKTAISVTAISAALLALIAAVHYSMPVEQGAQTEIRFLAIAAALIYFGVLALRVAADRNRARRKVASADMKRQLISQSVSDVFCEIDPEGEIRIAGGPVSDYFGSTSAVGSEDWLFQRLHVADRPLYLTRLSDTRLSGAASSFEVRMRVGSSLPGEEGQAEYRRVEMQLRDLQTGDGSTGTDKTRIFLKISLPDKNTGEQGRVYGSEAQVDKTDRISRAIVEGANSEAADALSRIDLQSERLRKLVDAGDFSTLRDVAQLIGETSKSCVDTLDLSSRFNTESADDAGPNYETVDLDSLLRRSAELIHSFQQLRNVEIEFPAQTRLPEILADEDLMQKALVFVLYEIAESAGSCAKITVTLHEENTNAELTFGVSNRASSLSWNSAGSRAVFEFANELLERTGAAVEIQSTLGHGDTVVLRLPKRTRKQVPTHSQVSDFDRQPMAKSA